MKNKKEERRNKKRGRSLMSVLCLAVTVMLLVMGSFMTGCKPKTKGPEDPGPIVPVVDDSPDDIQYMIWQLTNTHQTAVEYYVQEMKILYGENDPASKRVYGFGMVGPMLLNQSIEQMQEVINIGFDLAERYNVPVYFQIDDQNNYTTLFGDDADIHFYEDPMMCEWIDFPEPGEAYGGEQYGRPPRYWFDWGSWMYAPAAPNFESPGYKKLLRRNITEGVLRPLTQRYAKLLAQDKGWLFAGLAAGWETHIKYQANGGPMASMPVASNGEVMQEFESRQFGYGALHALGYTRRSIRREAEEKGLRETEMIEGILYDVIANHILSMCKLYAGAGLARHKIFTHIVSLSSSSMFTTSTFAPPIWTAVNEYSVAGYTMSPVSCPFDLDVINKEINKKIPGRNEFAVTEGYCAGYREEHEAEAYFKEFYGGNCRLLTAFGYTDKTVTFAFNRSPNFGFVKAFNRWKDGEILPGFVWSERGAE